MRCDRVFLVLVLGFLGSFAYAQDPSVDEPADPSSYRHGSLRLGAFWISRFDSSLIARSDDFPLGIYLDMSRELGLSDSVTVPRVNFSYRFSRRHQVNMAYFRIHRVGEATLDRTIVIGDTEIPEGSTVNGDSDSKIFKVAYTWIFYDNDKVALGATFGVNVVDFDLGLAVEFLDTGEYLVSEHASQTTPLPVLGLRLNYQATEKLTLLVNVDTLLVEAGRYGGTYHDSYVLLEWRLSKVFSIGGGLNFLALDLDYEQDVIAEFRHSYRGVAGFLGVHF